MEGTRSPERVEPPKPKNSKNPKPPLALFSSPLAAGEFHLSQVVDRPPNQPHRATSGKIGPSPRQLGAGVSIALLFARMALLNVYKGYMRPLILLRG